MSKVDLKKDHEKRPKIKVARKHKRDTKLQELEKQLQFAESRCRSLKQQLDYIKLLYGCNRFPQAEIRPAEGHGDGDSIDYLNFEDSFSWNNCHAINKIDSNEAVIKDLSHSNSTVTKLSFKDVSLRNHRNIQTEELKQKRCQKQKPHIILQKLKKKSPKRLKRRRKIDNWSSKFSSVSSQTKSPLWHDPVVEIYKNSAVNADSEIGLEIAFHNKKFKISESSLDLKKTNGFKESDSSKEKIVDKYSDTKNNFIQNSSGNFKEEYIQTDNSLDICTIPLKENEITEFLSKDNITKSGSLFSDPVKNYCQPTISSKKKQVDRDIYSNLTNINIRQIPFVAAKSTSPSHNIGVNIQQVLSIMKKRQMGNESLIGINETGQYGNLLMTEAPTKLGNCLVENNYGAGANGNYQTEPKISSERLKSNLSYWKSTPEINKHEKTRAKVTNESQSVDWTLKVNKLKKVLVFLHEDFTSLGLKYKKIKKKLCNQNITKTDAKGELAEIEQELEKKEEEITVVIGLYKEVLNLREDFKKIQEKYHTVTYGKSLATEGLRQSSSANFQMTSLLRKIQSFQDQMKNQNLIS